MKIRNLLWIFIILLTTNMNFCVTKTEYVKSKIDTALKSLGSVQTRVDDQVKALEGVKAADLTKLIFTDDLDGNGDTIALAIETANSLANKNIAANKISEEDYTAAT